MTQELQGQKESHGLTPFKEAQCTFSLQCSIITANLSLLYLTRHNLLL